MRQTRAGAVAHTLQVGAGAGAGAGAGRQTPSRGCVRSTQAGAGRKHK